MSDADDQMGGQGGETGREPGKPPDKPKTEEDAEAAVDEQSGQSFPASDPPANY